MQIRVLSRTLKYYQNYQLLSWKSALGHRLVARGRTQDQSLAVKTETGMEMESECDTFSCGEKIAQDLTCEDMVCRCIVDDTGLSYSKSGHMETKYSCGEDTAAFGPAGEGE